MTPHDKENPSEKNFDLCVYNNDKDIVDNQVVILQYANGVRATFSLQLFAPKGDRSIMICGSEGYVSANLSDKIISVHSSIDQGVTEHDLGEVDESGHSGGDEQFIGEFIEAIRDGHELPVDLMAGLATTVIGNAIEEARKTGKMVKIPSSEYQV